MEDWKKAFWVTMLILYGGYSIIAPRGNLLNFLIVVLLIGTGYHVYKNFSDPPAPTESAVDGATPKSLSNQSIGTYTLATALGVGSTLSWLSSVYIEEMWSAIWVLQPDGIVAIWTWIFHMFTTNPFITIWASIVLILAFGRSIERTVGTKLFVTTFFVAGVSTDILHVTILQNFYNIPDDGGLIGPTAAVYGILAIPAIANPELKVGKARIPHIYLAGLAFFAFYPILVSFYLRWTYYDQMVFLELWRIDYSRTLLGMGVGGTIGTLWYRKQEDRSFPPIRLL